MPAARPIRKAAKKIPYAKTRATTSASSNNGKTLSPKPCLLTMGPDIDADKILSPVVKNKKAAGRRSKLAPVTTDAHSSDANADEDLVPVVQVKKGTTRRGKTGQGPSAQVKPARALPNRSGCNIHPAGLPKSRRSKEQVDADRKAALKASEEQAHKSQTAKDFLARMNVLEECEEEDLPALFPQRLSARINKRCHADTESESDECFDIRVDEGSDDLDSPLKSDKATEANVKRTKRVKGAAHQELLSMTRALRERGEKSQAGTSGHGVGRLTTQDLACKKYANSGLRPQVPRPPTAASTARDQQGDIADPFEFGGLCDDDIEETRPIIVEDQRAVVTANQSDFKNPSRSNELVKVKSRSNDVHQGKRQAMPKPTKSKATMATVKESSHKRQDVVNVNPLTGVLPDISRQCLNDARWTNVFLPTLTHALYISDHPFTDWSLGSSKLIKTIQKVFDLSFANVSYTLSPEDPVFKAAYDRMKTRRSKLASEILTSVKIFFDRAEFRNRLEKVTEYVHGALRWGGPAYFENFVPVSCKLEKDDPNYPKADGVLCSQFILPIAKAYIDFAAKSVLRPSLGAKNPPVGMYALILTAVERAFKAHLTGSFKAPSDFNGKATRKSMRDFYNILGQLRESHWEQALSFASFDDGTESYLDESMLSAYRVDFYLPPSSPICDA